MRKKLLFVFCAAFFIFLDQTTWAQVKGNPRLRSVGHQPISFIKSSSKLSTGLKNLYDDHVADVNKARVKPTLDLHNDGLKKFMQMEGENVQVEVTLNKDSNTTIQELKNAGLQINNQFGRVISGMIPIDALPKLEAVTSVRFVQPAYKPMHQSGFANTGINRYRQASAVQKVISQGDTAQRSYLARKRYKVNGNGVKVGILSDSYNNLGTSNVGVANGELPGLENPFGFNTPVEVLKDLDSSGRDEGRAMAEIVHDVAPGAQLAFRTGFLGQADFAFGILELQRAGCQIITDDLIYFAEPFFQDGILAQAVDIVKQQGVTYISAAQNQSVRSYESDYRSTTFTPFGPDFGTAHNFGAPGNDSIYFQPVFIPSDGLFIASFQWDEPFFSAGFAGSESDLDIYLLDSLGTIVAAGFEDNIASGDPVELLGFINDTESNVFYITIIKYAGRNPSKLKYIFYGDGAFYLTTPAIPGILSPTLIGHVKAEGAIATAAAFYKETPAYDVDTPRVEPFSSVGGVPNYFDKYGFRIPTLIRKKPEISAPDGGNTSFFDPFGDGDIASDTDMFPNFFGTSAAAPHAAGIAALMIEAEKRKTITPDQIKGILSASTIDMDNIYTPEFDRGFDFGTGSGLVKADAAVRVVKSRRGYIKDLQVLSICSNDPLTTQAWKVINPNPFTVQAQWFLKRTSQQGTIEALPGETFFTSNVYARRSSHKSTMVLYWNDNFGVRHADVAHGRRNACSQVVSNNQSEVKTANVAETEKPDLENMVQIMPNPTSGTFKVYLPFGNRKNINVELYSIEGKLAYKKVMQANGVITVDISGYKPGIYILKIGQGAEAKAFKIVKQ